MNEPMSTYEILPAILRGYEHTAGETCQETNPVDLCVPCRAAYELERLYKDFNKYRKASLLYEKMNWDLTREADAWHKAAHNLLRTHGDPTTIQNLSDNDIEHMLQAEYGKVANKP